MADIPAPAWHEAAALFILSFRHRDELTAAADRGGWRPIAGRRAAGAERRFIASGAGIAIVDGRGAFHEAIGATRALADAAEANAASLLVLLSRNDVVRLPDIYAAGATHYLTSPFSEAELLQAIRFAARHAERLGGPVGRPKLARSEDLSWRFGHGRLLLSPALAQRLGTPLETLSTRQAYGLLSRGDRPAARAARQRLKAGYGTTAFSHALADGTRVVHHLSASDGSVLGVVEALDPAETSDQMMRRDPLTGLPDAAAARRWLGRHAAQGRPLGLLLIALDRLEMVNNIYSRVGGDRLLQAAARRIESTLRDVTGSRGWMARLAGTEFVAALPDASIEELGLLAAAIQQAVERRFVAAPDIYFLSAKIGGVLHCGEDAGQALRRASAALAEAREQSGSAIRISEAEAGSEPLPLAVRLAEELRQALADDQIEVLFQPQVSIATGEIIGVEALARWRHPELGEVGAEALFAAAERATLVPVLSEHIQDRALALASAWPEALHSLRLSLNVRPDEISGPGFDQSLLDRVDSSGFPRSRVTLELTEESFIDDLGAAATVLANLRQGGCRVAVDDFGTGYSSLAYLKALPLDYLKLDRRLSQDIAGSSRDRVVVRGVIDMARSLGISVIAEGVETEEQLALLAAEGCTIYQGFLCSGPIAVDQLARIVAFTGART
ncbi:bifunctional diguanylate cyclase/phosphodiesterase [Sphingomonas sp.]|uniref:putative bifunctional diguanylate cyclase/phosphodiesterase n=1 Tax=Sphingomonas sp. TaxID=28214 RepID=UPI002DEA39F7|nr:bifunctional diguanylate cyclase/phosphodiesterase [Sphingomonas sp.]